MYRTCIFCSARLKSNDVLERFPVGRSIAFDGEKGRLWAVCPQCARWNLAPIEERWEAIEDAERLFHDTRTRVQRENVGLAKLRDGTRLIRIGPALSGELAAWRYGGELGRRRRQYALSAAGLIVITAGVTGSFALGAITIGPVLKLGWLLSKRTFSSPEVRRFPSGTLLPEQAVDITTDTLRRAVLVPDPAGGAGPALMLPGLGWGLVRGPDGQGRWGSFDAVATGADAHDVLRRGLVHLNARGASRTRIGDALGLLSPIGAGGYLDRSVAERARLVNPALSHREQRARLLALEMALHEETERQALEGELAALTEMWRQAEEIAGIADALPDAAPVPEPPRLG